MKTVFQRVLSVILCVILVLSTMSVMAFAADGNFTYQYKTYSQRSNEENIHYLMDLVDEVLEEENIYEKIVLIEKTWLVPEVSIVIDLTSIDKICETLDDYRTIINLAKGLLGDLGDLELGVFEKGLSRADGDVKVISEFLELAAANGGIIEKLLNGTLDLGTIGSSLGIDLKNVFGAEGISGLVKELVVGLVYDEGTSAYTTGLATAKTNFDKFIYQDIIGLLSKEGGLLEGITIDANTTIDTLIIDVFNILVKDYLIDLVDGVTFDFTTVFGTEYAQLNTVVQLDGDYDFTNIKFTADDTVINQVNNVIGAVVNQIVPGYTWTNGTYTLITQNMEGLFAYIADNSMGLITGTTFDEQVVEVIKLILSKVNSTAAVYEAIKDCANLDEMADAILAYFANNKGIAVAADADYEEILGDIIIHYVGGHVLIADKNGKELKVGGGNDVWTVANCLLNFFFVDKGMGTLIGKNMTKDMTFFQKVDIIGDMLADDGTSAFDSNAYLAGEDGLINSVLTLDIAQFVELTAVKASKVGSVSFVNFLYSTVYNFLNNWADSSTALTNHASASSTPFNSLLSNNGIANLVKVGIETLSKRGTALCSAIGLMFGLFDAEIVVTIPDTVYTGSINPAVTVTARGRALTRDKDYTVTVNGSGLGKATATITGIGAYEKEITKEFNVVFGKISGATASAAKNSVALKWNALAGAKEYRIYNGSKFVATVTGTSYTVSGLSACTNYSFSIEAVNDSYTSAKTVVNTKTAHDAVNDNAKAASCTATGLTAGTHCSVCKAVIKAQTTVSAKGHKSDGGKVTKAATYTAKGVKTYTCTVCKTVIKKESIKRLTLAKVTGLTAKNVKTNSIKFTWAAVTGATSYEFYYSTNGKKWTKVTTTGTSVTIKKLKAGTSYKVKVIAVAGSNKSKASDILTSATKPAKVTLSSVKSTNKKQAVVTWKTVKGANGYQVTYSTSKKFAKKNTKNVSVKKQKTKKTTLKKLKSGKKYFVKVRAYKTVNGTKLYGAYSKVLSVKVK